MRATVALIAGLLAAAGLMWAAFGLLRSPQVESEAALSRVAGDVADGVVAEWTRVLRDEDVHARFGIVGGGIHFPGAPINGIYIWHAGVDDVLPVATPHEVRAERSSQHLTFDALLSEARRFEIVERRPDEALAGVLRALEKPPDDDARAEGRLRAIQLAVKANRPEVAQAQWRQAVAEQSGDEAQDGVSVLLLCGLAAAPALSEPEAQRAYADLAQRWADGELALPDPADDFVAGAANPQFGTRVPPRRAALRQRLLALDPAGAADDPRWAIDAQHRMISSLMTFVDNAPSRASSQGTWQILPGTPPFVWFEDHDWIDGLFTSYTAMGRNLAARLEVHHLVPDGFGVDFSAGDESLGPVVRARTPLLGDAFGFVLRHRDPQAFLSAERRRTGWLRAGLVLTAAFIVAAAVSTARALRRERALAGLKSAFIASVSHELRTPVSSILLLAENLESGRVVDESARHRYHGLIRREAQRLRRLVDDVLDISRLERGDGPHVRLVDVGLHSFLDDVTAEARELVERSGGVWHVQGALAADTRGTALPESATLDADAVRRAVLNLVDNALRHSGSRDVTFSAHVDGVDLLLSVADRGHGISAPHRERIFQPFERLGSERLGVPGAGLGLSIVRGIARGHGGDVAVRDHGPGPGSRFELRLPVLGSRAMIAGDENEPGDTA